EVVATRRPPPNDTSGTRVGRLVVGVAPLGNGFATGTATLLLLGIGPLDGAEAQLDVLRRHAVVSHRGGDAVDQHVEQLDRVVVDRVAVLVCTHDFDAVFWVRGTV